MPVETRSRARARRLHEEAIIQAANARIMALRRQLLADEAHQRVLVWRQAPVQRHRYETRLAQADAARHARMRTQLRQQAEEGPNYIPSPSSAIATTLPDYDEVQDTDRLQGIVLSWYTNPPCYPA